MTEGQPTVEQLADRLSKVERANRRLWMAMILIVVGLAVMWWGAVSTATRGLSSLAITDASGKVRTLLVAGSLLMMDENGNTRVSVSADSNESSLMLSGQGKESISVRASHVYSGFDATDADGVSSVSFNTTQLGPSLLLGSQAPKLSLGVSKTIGKTEGDAFLEVSRSGRADKPFAGFQCYESRGCRQSWPGFR